MGATDRPIGTDGLGKGAARVRRTAILLGGIAVLALLLTPATGTAQQQPGTSPALFARGRERGFCSARSSGIRR